MSEAEQVKAQLRGNLFQDLALVILFTIVCSLLAIRYEWTERFFAWTRRWESLQLDEIAFVLLSLSVGLTWFSMRRWREARRELDIRLQAQNALLQQSSPTAGARDSQADAARTD